MSEQLTNWERQNNGYISARSPEDARHPHTIKESNHPDVVVERVEEIEDTVTRLTLEMAEVNKKLDHHDAVLYKLGVALYDRKLANKENKLPLGVQEKLEDAWDKRKADNFQEKEDGHSNPRL